MKKHLIYWLAAVLIVAVGCQKELSFEGSNSPAKGSLRADVTGDCFPKTVNGTYVAGTALVPATNTITVQVNVTKTGTYVVYTDTMNGFYFRGIGAFTTLGANNVTLRSNGTPFTVGSGVTNFVVRFDTTFCDIQVSVISPGIGTLAGAPNACTPIRVNGGYSPGVALTAANNAVVTVNVTTAGLINITTDTLAGIWFRFSGNLPFGSGQNVTLVAYGSIPAATVNGPQTFTVKLGASRCTFVVNVASPAVGTVDCTGATFAGTFTAGVAMTASNTVQISVTVITPGAYNITTDTVNGVWFNASGIFPTATTTPVTLTGNGIPAISGPITYTVKWGTSTCTFVCNFLSNDYFPRTINSNWSYEFDDNINPADTLLRKVVTGTVTALGNPFNIFMESVDVSGVPPFDSSGYYRKSSGDYFEWFDYGTAFNYDPPPAWAQYIMLKDNVPATPGAGSNWKSNGFAGTQGGFPFNMRFSYTVIQKDVPITVMASTGSTIYQNVIVVEEKYELEIAPGVWQDLTPVFGYGRSYYSRGIGLIKYEFFDGTGNLQFLQELRRHQVF